ncbi:hypothetical protein B0A52_01468 [Exophiala mesophila]|uniref:Uncharacterized protein n=1 Tax=Exophiala mesophila TaxID=212818 RepID=A0A438NF41_EXOME|nr:hypothetical protein B0A52_01468 [Exophiala mesophila]
MSSNANFEWRLYPSPTVQEISTYQTRAEYLRVREAMTRQRLAEIDFVLTHHHSLNKQGMLYSPCAILDIKALEGWKPAEHGLIEFPRLVEKDDSDPTIESQTHIQTPITPESSSPLHTLLAAGDWLLSKLVTGNKRKFADADFDDLEDSKSKKIKQASYTSNPAGATDDISLPDFQEFLEETCESLERNKADIELQLEFNSRIPVEQLRAQAKIILRPCKENPTPHLREISSIWNIVQLEKLLDRSSPRRSGSSRRRPRTTSSTRSTFVSTVHLPNGSTKGYGSSC